MRVEQGKILISIPFNPSDPWESYVLQPFPTRFGASMIPKVSNYRALVLLSRTENIYTVVYDDDKHTLNCINSLNSKICSIDSFVFRKVDAPSCLLQLVLNGTFLGGEDRCLAGCYDFEADTYLHRLTNGSTILYGRDEFQMSCPRGSVPKTSIGLLVDGCNATSENYKSFGLTTLTRGYRYFLNSTWGFTTVTVEMPVFTSGLHNVTGEGEPVRQFHETGVHIDLVLPVLGTLALLTAFVGAIVVLGLHIRRNRHSDVASVRKIGLSGFTGQRSAAFSRPVFRFT